MTFTLVWNPTIKGSYVARRDDGAFICEKNAEWSEVVSWLSGQGKTLEQWLAENPAPTPDINTLKKTKGTELKRLIDDTIAKHYSPFDILSLTNLKLTSLDKPNRLAYLGQLETWLLSSYQLFYAAEAKLAAASTVEGVQSTTIDIQAFEAAKPNVRYVEALAIQD